MVVTHTTNKLHNKGNSVLPSWCNSLTALLCQSLVMPYAAVTAVAIAADNMITASRVASKDFTLQVYANRD